LLVFTVVVVDPRVAVVAGLAFAITPAAPLGGALAWDSLLGVVLLV
jgi:hypothetical protein